MPGKNATRNAPEAARVWNLTDIQELFDLLAAKEITEFEMEQQGVKIRVRRGSGASVAAAGTNGYTAQAALPAVAPLPVAPIAAAPAASVTGSTAVGTEPGGEAAEGLVVIKSPIVGTFYAAPSPNAPPFVKVGDSVSVGQVVCIIEAMKLMNELEAEVAGTVVRAYVETGQPVEYGQSLFAVEPVRKK